MVSTTSPVQRATMVPGEGATGCADLPVLVEAILRCRWSPAPALQQAVDAAAERVCRPACVSYAPALLGAVKSDRELLTMTVRALAARSDGLNADELSFLVKACKEAVELLPESGRDAFFDLLVAERCYGFLRADLMLTIEEGPIEDMASRFAHDFARLPPSAKGRMDQDLLVARCLKRFGPEPLASQLDELLDVVPLKELKDDFLQESIVARYAGALDLGDVEARHERRLAYLLRYSNDLETRSRLMIREDLARLAAVPVSGVRPERVLGRLEWVPRAFEHVPQNEVERFVAMVLRKLPPRLGQQEHVAVGQKLFHPAHGEVFFRVMFSRLRRVAGNVLESEQAGLWTDFFAAWLTTDPGEASEVVHGALQSGVRTIDGRLRREINTRLKHRTGRGLELLLADKGWYRWVRLLRADPRSGGA